MANDSGRGFFTLTPRRKTANLLLQPVLQLKLPLYLLLLTLGTGLLLTAHTWVAYERLFAAMLQHADQPEYFKRVVEVQTGDFLTVSAAIAIAYALVVLATSVVYVHKLVGPTIAFRRQIEALKNGDYAARVKLRKGDAFREVEKDLNELAEILELSEKADRAPHS